VKGDRSNAMNIKAPTETTRATLADLERTPEKAELIDGRIVPLMPTGFQPGRVALRIARSLDERTEATGRGFAFGDNVGFVVPGLASGRESFAPDAAYFDGPPPMNRMRFIAGAPTFAVEVRSENDYGAAAEADLARKRADYFEAGTLLVWDVDPVAGCVRAYDADTPDPSRVFLRGQVADAEPVVPDWRIAVDRIFP
jgi:Uma2 family endonuclease